MEVKDIDKQFYIMMYGVKYSTYIIFGLVKLVEQKNEEKQCRQ